MKHILMWICILMALISEPSWAIGRKAALGRNLFFDANLSSPPGQACASCHQPEHFFTDPDSDEATSEGVIKERYGARNTPTILYAKSAPAFHFDQESQLFIGGQFADGRAATLKEQAKGPFFGPLEMNNSTPGEVIEKIRRSPYASEFLGVYGANALNNPDTAFEKVTDAISAFEKTSTFTPFSSKYDLYLQGKARFNAKERRGREIYEREDKGNCAACHPSRSKDPASARPFALFTDYTYDNLGVPRNPENRFYLQPPELNAEGNAFIDLGLGGVLGKRDQRGKFKVPTLRNIAKTAPYMHNGYFKTLKGVLDFYNTRDLKPSCRNPMTTEDMALRLGCWPAPEVSLNVNRSELGHLNLSEQEIADLLTFLMTLTDGYRPP